MAEQSIVRAGGWLRIARELDPFRATWRLFTSVRWAIGIIAFLAAAGLVGVLIPQVPLNVRGDPAAEAGWLAVQEGRFGFLTDAMDRLGLFDVFHAPWFVYALGLLVASVSVCTASRLPSIWRAVSRPRKRVNDSYFTSARHRYDYATPASGHDLERVLRRGRYAVERYEEGDATYLFADRFQFAQLATFVSHLALIVLLAAGLVSRFVGFSNGMMIAEGASAPVFPLKREGQMQVQLVDMLAQFSPDGRPLEYRSDLRIFKDGEEVKRCASTVNSPCSYNGYRFHQAAYFGFGADVQVRDTESGNVVYRETLTLSDTLPSPRVVVRDESGKVLLDESLVLTDVLSTDEFVYYGRIVNVGGRTLTIGARRDGDGGEWKLAVLEADEREDAVRLALSKGETRQAGGLEFTYAGLSGTPASFVSDLPLPPGSEPGSVLLEMSNVVYGGEKTSAGGAVARTGADGPPQLTVVGLDPQAVTLEPGEKRQIGPYEYSFLGQREFSGIQVKRDDGDLLIWAGTGLLIAGLMLTFWVPRRRLWARITSGRTYLAGQAGHFVNLSKEMADMAEKAGARPEEKARRELDV